MLGIGNIQSMSNKVKHTAIVEGDYSKESSRDRSIRMSSVSTLMGAKFQQQRSYSMQQDTSPLQIINNFHQETKLFSLPLKEKFGHCQSSKGPDISPLTVTLGKGGLYGSKIDIQVINPTPNMSPTESRGSSSGDETRNVESHSTKFDKTNKSTYMSKTSSCKDTKANMISNTPSIAIQSTVEVLSTSDQDYSYSLTEISGSPNTGKNKDGVRRKVSFSSDGTAEVDDPLNPASNTMPAALDNFGSICDETISPTVVRRRKSGQTNYSLRNQATIPGATNNPNTMTYLQVPGQTTVIQAAIAPQLSPEAKKAQMSSSARQRRQTRLMKAGSFCSITSEGDGDIFELTGELKQPEVSMSTPSTQSIPLCLSTTPSSEDKIVSSFSARIDMRKPSDPLSEYSEFLQDDCHSDISELFGHKSPNKHPSTSTRQSSDSSNGENDQQDQASAVYNLNLDQEDIVFVEVPYKGDCHVTDGALYQKSYDSNVGNTSPPRQKSVYDSDRKTSVDVGVQSPPPIHRGEDQAINQPQKQRKGGSEARKKRKTMAIKKESFVMPDITVHDDGKAECEVEDELYESSSCSISIGSDNESSHQVLTVPVTIEHPPPEMRPTDEEAECNTFDQVKQLEGQNTNVYKQPGAAEKVSKEARQKLPKPLSQHHHHHHHHRRQGKEKYTESRSIQDQNENRKDNTTHDMSMLGSLEGDKTETDDKHLSRVITTSDAGCQQAVPSSFVSRYYATSTSLSSQGSKMIKSAGCSPLPKTRHNFHPTGIKSDEPQRRAPIVLGEGSPELHHQVSGKKPTEVDQSEAKLSPKRLQDGQTTSSVAELTTTGVGVRMVLVRDIGIQVSGNSPNLNLTRRHFKKQNYPSQQHSFSTVNATPIGHNTTSRKYHTTGRGTSSNFASCSATTQMIEKRPVMAASTSSNVIRESLVGNPRATTSALPNSMPDNNKKEPSKNFPPEILF